MRNKHGDVSSDKWWADPNAGEKSCVVDKPDPQAAATKIAKALAAKIHGVGTGYGL